MQLTIGQVREILDVPQETFRHWKKALPILTERNGYRPCFSLGDLLALAVIKILTYGAGVRVGALSDASRSLFALCNATSWVIIERGGIAVDTEDGSAKVFSSAADVSVDSVVVLVAGGPLVLQLRARLLAENVPDPQGAIPFPLQSVAKKGPLQSIVKRARDHSSSGARR